MMEANALYKETMKILREKAQVKAADIAPVMKARMLKALDERIAAIAELLEALDRPQGQTGAVQAPQGAQARPK